MAAAPNHPLPRTMRAIQAVDGRGGVSLINLPVPELSRGKVLVRMTASPINPSDLFLIHNISGRSRSYPQPAGREGSGTVVAAGPGLFGRRLVGKRVAFAGSGGAWAEYALVPALTCIPLPDEVSFEQGASLIVNPLSALILMDIARKGRHRAVVSTAAAGQLGRMLLRLGKKYRKPIIHVVRNKEQVRLLTDLGARHVLDSSDPDFEQQLRELAARLKATLFLDSVSGALTGQLIAAAPRRSVLISYGNLSRQPVSFEPSRLWTDEIRIEGFFLGTWLATRGPLAALSLIRRALRLLKGELTTSYAQRFLLTEIDRALAFAQNRATEGRALLVIDPEQIELAPG